jgi:hypothetical protein
MAGWTLPEVVMNREDWWTVHDALMTACPPNETLAAQFPDRNVELLADPLERLTFGPFSDAGFDDIIGPLTHCPLPGAKMIASLFQKLALETAEPA